MLLNLKLQTNVLAFFVAFFVAAPLQAAIRDFDGMYYCQESASVSIIGGAKTPEGVVNANKRFSIKVKQGRGSIEVKDNDKLSGTYEVANVTDLLIHASSPYGSNNFFTLSHGVKVADNSDAYMFRAAKNTMDIKTAVSRWNISEGSCEKW